MGAILDPLIKAGTRGTKQVRDMSVQERLEFQRQHPVIGQLLPAKKTSGEPPRAPTTDDVREVLKDGDWSKYTRAFMSSAPMEGTAGTFGGSVSMTIQNPAGDTPESVDPAAHLKLKAADVRYLGSGRTPPLSKDEKEYEIAKAVAEAAIEETPALAKAARAKWSGGEILASDEAQLKSAITRLLAQQPELARELKQVFEV